MDRRNLTLLTDLYELTMMQGYFERQENEIVIFDSLTKEQLIQIIDLLLKSTSYALENKDIKLIVLYAAEFIYISNCYFSNNYRVSS